MQEYGRGQMHSELPQTQGRRGQKRVRINMAYTDENHDFVRTNARKMGLTMTQYMNRILDEARSRENDKRERK